MNNSVWYFGSSSPCQYKTHNATIFLSSGTIKLKNQVFCLQSSLPSESTILSFRIMEMILSRTSCWCTRNWWHLLYLAQSGYSQSSLLWSDIFSWRRKDWHKTYSFRAVHLYFRSNVLKAFSDQNVHSCNHHCISVVTFKHDLCDCSNIKFQLAEMS